MGLEVQAHGTRASFGRNIFDNREFVRRIFVDDRKVAIAAGSERVSRRGIKSAGIRAFADGRSGHDLAGIRVHHGHHFFVADGKEAAIGDVHGQPGRRFARRKRPVVEFLEALRVEEFGLAIERDRADYGAIRGVDGGGVFAAAVEGEDALGDGIVEDGVGIAVCLYRADRLQRLEVENRDVVAAAVAGETAAEVGSDGNAVNPFGVRDVANDGVGVRIENHDVRAARDVNAAGVTIHVDVIPTALAADRDGFDDVIARTRRRRYGRARECYRRKDDRNCE